MDYFSNLHAANVATLTGQKIAQQLAYGTSGAVNMNLNIVAVPVIFNCNCTMPFDAFLFWFLECNAFFFFKGAYHEELMNHRGDWC